MSAYEMQYRATNGPESVRPFLGGKIDVGVNMMIARGYTGQTTESFATNYAPGQVGLVDGAVPANPISEVVGVRIPSYASLNFTYRFGRKMAP